ncbi:glycoside hydrolase/deacetylase [Rickenella mellea]|uniref:chitin deacetylase n=1 Tax=Rickenella mellea TaxID=50990 RepID=A0A4R5XFD5_9AGAM|nr:glycoside hydrolase/deacetylase [Rickenella mellea]
MSALLLFATSALLASVSVYAHPHDSLHARHEHAVRAALPDTWYHTEEIEAHKLFRRDAAGTPSTDGGSYPQVGSPTWLAAYPSTTPDNTKLPQAWVDKLNAAVAAGQIPNIPQTTEANGSAPVYPQGVQQDSTDVCSTTNRVCRNPDDIWDAPPGTVGIGFDDGPLPTSAALFDFLTANNQKATHFFIGVNILASPDLFTRAFATMNDDIAVHTYTHPYMTTLTNIDVVAQLGWSMQLIHDSTGGRLPRYWRPPYGDTDNRVGAIARHVFGLKTIIWNQDTSDWSLGQAGGTTLDAINANMQKWLTGPKSPGLIILEHELTKDSVQGFINNYPLMKSNGWQTVSMAQLAAGQGANLWQNAAGNTSPVTSMAIVAAAAAPTNGSSTPPPTTTGSSGTATSAGSSTGSKGSAAAQATGSGKPKSGASSLRYPSWALVLAAAWLALL